MRKPTESRQIYVACLASYNAGILHGAWIDASQEEESLSAEIKSTVLDTSPIPHAEEWAIHDTEGLGDLIGEYSSLQEVSSTAAFLDEHGDLGAKLLGDYTMEEAQQMLEENYAGAYDDSAAFAEELTRECHQIPEYLEYYINWEAMARDMEYSGDISSIGTKDGKQHIFWNR